MTAPTPAALLRAALRLADALSVIADELVRPDACAEILAAHANCAIELCDALVRTPAKVPAAAGPGMIAEALESEQGPSAATLLAWSDAWRTWGSR